MSSYSQPTYRLKERLYENSEKSIIIFRARRKKTIKHIVVKAYYKIKHPSYDKEYLILKNINCPSIVNVIGAAEDRNNFYMEMEYCSSADLSHCLWPNRGSNYIEKVIKEVSTQLLIGLKVLHTNGVIHCNLKPSNILIDEYGNAKICDFKKALKINEMTSEDIRRNKMAMTPCYTAPELFSNDGDYTFKTDLWALGCIMYEMAVGQVPFFDVVVNDLILKIINEDVNFNRKQFNKYSPEFMEVLQRLLEKDPEIRPSWGEIENFPFWSQNEKGFYDAFPNLNFNYNYSNKNLLSLNNININYNNSNTSIFSNNSNKQNNLENLYNSNYNHSNSDCNIININNKLNNNSWNNKNKNTSINSCQKLVMSPKMKTVSDFGTNINKTKSTSINSKIKIKQISPSPKSRKQKLKLNEIKQFQINEEDMEYNNKPNNDNDSIDENDREFNFNLGDNNHNIPLEENYGFNKFKKLEMSQNRNILSLSEFNVSKIMDKNKQKKVNDSNDMTLSLANPNELPHIQYLMIHNSDKNIKPIIGNRIIEQKKFLVKYDENKIPFKPIYKMDKLKELIKGGNVAEFGKYLNQLYFHLNEYKKNKKIDITLNLLNYLETIILSKDISNNIINTPLLKLLIECLEISDDKIRIRACSIIANIIRYSTNLNVSLDKYKLTEILISFISDTNVFLNRKAMATLGEYLFFVSTQVEVELDYIKKGAKPNWSISQECLKALLLALNHTDEKVRFYSLKTIENICILTTVSKNYFAVNDDFITKIIDIINSPCENPEIRTSAISSVSHIIRLNPSLFKIFIEKMDNINIVIENENQKNQQYIINCLLFGIELDKKNTKFISKIKLMSVLISLLDNSNNVIKQKVLLLISLIFNEVIIIIKYGDNIFNIVHQLRKEKKLFYYHVKIFESYLQKYCQTLIKYYKNYSEENKINSNENQKQNNNKLISLLKCLNIIAPYYKVSYVLFNNQFLDLSINNLMNCNLNTEKAELILELLKSFSENSISVLENCDFIINKIFKKILLLTKKINYKYKRFPLNICANIISVLLEDENLYSSTSLEEGKTNQINNLIIDILPDIYDLLINKETVYESLAFLSLIIERNIAFIRFYKSIGIIDYIFILMKEENVYSNLNLIKILIKYIESNETTFQEIIESNLIDKVNYLIMNDSDEITIYTEYVIEMFFDLMFKINEMKRKFESTHNKEDVQKNFMKKIEGVAANFPICIRLLSCDNFNLQEKSCFNLIFILQFFPNMYIKSVNVNVKFTEEDIPDLLKALDSGNEKIYKKMIKIFKWIVECQKNATTILKNYTSYIQICIEKIINITDDPSVVEIAKAFLKKDFPKLL